MGEAGQQAIRGAFIAFYDSQYHLVVRFVMLNGASLDDAYDAAQEAFLEAWTKCQCPDRWNLIDNREAWIRRVALNKYWRPPGPRRRLKTLPLAEAIAGPGFQAGADPADETARAVDLLTAMRSLDDDVRAVLAFHLDGFPVKTIAASMDMTDQKVRDLLKKGRRKVGDAIREDKQKEDTQSRGGSR